MLKQLRINYFNGLLVVLWLLLIAMLDDFIYGC